MRTAPRVISVLALAAALAAPAASRAWTYGDTLTTLMRPLPNLPAFARPGDAVTVWANAGPGVTGWNAALQFAALSVPLVPSGGGYQASKGRWELQFTIPAGTPEELYDLVLASSGTLPDVARTAVKVLPAYASDFYFAQISDTHLPMHPFSSDGGFNANDTTGMGDFSAVIADLNVIHPEFVLLTGDFVNEGELEEHLAVYEMGRAVQMLSRLVMPTFVVSGNHDVGGWKPTPPPDGTARKNWWRQLGWKHLASPPAGDPNHSQNYSFDYGLLHVIGMETYINNGSYDSYQPAIWGAQSMTAEQMSWLAADVAAVPAGHAKLAFFHYDFGGTLGNGQPAPSGSQFNNPAALGLDGVIWGHNHGVAEGNRAARPFNLGCQAVIDGRRVFRTFRVSNGVISPGPMHRAGGTATIPTDSLTVAWSDLNNGSQVKLTATVVNRYGETWERASLRFVMADHDSAYAASVGTVSQTIREGGRINVYVDCVLPAGGTTVVTVTAVGPLAVERPGERATRGLRLESPVPSPWRIGEALTLRYTLPTAGPARITLIDAQGRRVAEIAAGEQAAGPHAVTWHGPGPGHLARGVYVVRLETAQGTRTRKLTVTR